MSIKTKYAPTSLNEVIYPCAATELRVKSLAEGSLGGHVLFYGPRGTAKTTTANLLAHAVGGSQARIESDFVNLLAMPNLKNYLRQACFDADLIHKSKLILLFNEFDNYKPTPYQLWDAMDELQEKGLMLIITTNNEGAIHQSILDRCQCIEFPKVSAIKMLPRAQQILSVEGLVLPDEQVLSYLKVQERLGSLRKYTTAIEELLVMKANELPFPQWSGQKPSLKVV